jgi:hypothetical protein
LVADAFHVSTKTKMSSAPMQRIRKMMSCCISTRQNAHAYGSDATISNTPVTARKMEPTLNQM